MLKTVLLAVTATLISSSALAWDQSDRDAPLGILVPEPGVYIALPGEAPVSELAPQVDYAPAPVPDQSYQVPAQWRPRHYRRVFVSQPAQPTSLRQFK
jgi:hypothetical protein